MESRPGGPGSGAAAGLTSETDVVAAEARVTGAAAASSFLDVAGRRLNTDAAALAILLVLALIAFAPWWLGGRIIAPLDTLHEAFAPWNAGDEHIELHNHFTSDAITQYIVYRRIAERSFALDGTIGWNDLTGGGRPEYANTMALYGDWTMQLHRVLDFWTAWHVGLLAQLLIAALGMFVLLRSRGCQPLTALAGAVAFASSTQFIFTLYHRWHLAAFAWVPWMAWAMLRWRAGSRLHWLLVPIFLGLALGSGSLQTAAFLLIVLGALWAGWLLEVREARARRQLTLCFLGWGLLGAALASFTLLPALLMYLDATDLHGARTAPGFHHGVLQPLFALAFIPAQLFPTLLGSPASLDLAKLFRADLAYIAFFGLLPTAVALRCAVRRSTPAALRLLILAGLLIPLTPLVGSLYHRVQLVFVFGGAWAFAEYWEARTEPGERGWRRLVVLAAVLGVAWLVASVALWLAEARLTAVVQAQVAGMLDGGGGGRLGGFRDWMLARAGSIVRELRIWQPAQLAMVAGAALALAALRLRLRGRLEAATLVLLAALVLELGTLTLRWHTAVEPGRHAAYPVTDDLAALQSVAAGGRVFVAAESDGPAPFFPPNTLAMYDVATIDQYETVDLHGMWQLADRSADARLLARLGVTHAVAPAGAAVHDGWRLTHAGATFDIWENLDPAPRYAAIDGTAATGAADRVAAANEAGAAGTDRAAVGRVRVLHETPNRRLLEVTGPAAGVRIAENWSEGWEYRVGEGAWRAVERAVDRSMVVPLAGAGEARVELRYRPQRRRAGRAVTGFAGLVLVAAAAGAVLRERRRAGRMAG